MNPVTPILFRTFVVAVLAFLLYFTSTHIKAISRRVALLTLAYLWGLLWSGLYLAQFTNAGYRIDKVFVLWMLNTFLITGVQTYWWLASKNKQPSWINHMYMVLVFVIFAAIISEADMSFRHLAFLKLNRVFIPIGHVALLTGGGLSITIALIITRRWNTIVERIHPAFPLLLVFACVFLFYPNVTLLTAMVFARIAHDVFHWASVFLLLPDHPYLSNLVWEIIGLLFKKGTGVLIAHGAFAILAATAFGAFYYHRDIPPEELSGPERRLWLAANMRRKRLNMIFLVPVFISIFASLTHYRIKSQAIFDPDPVPVELNKDGRVYIPVKDTGDGSMHKFSVSIDRVKIRFIVLKKPDGKWSVVLDACNICPPQGYAQITGALFCKYCGTPIPLNTVGLPGGCNPVPVEFHISDGFIIVDGKQLKNTWINSTRGK